MAGERRRRAQRQALLRSVVAVSLIVTWAVAAFSGFMLYLAPHGPRSGRISVFLLTKGEWSDVHFWVSVLAIGVTLVHLTIDWRALKACVRYLVSVNRPERPCE